MTDNDYHQRVDAMFLHLEQAIDEVEQADLDYESSGGILTIEFVNKTKLILNKQTPNQQIWLATKYDGHHFDLIDEQWIDNRTGIEFWQLVSQAASRQAGVEIVFNGA
ncbi:MAG: CyaY protein [Alteromonadaceae bacterium]|jgi:CyaY protein